ncbi:putative uncharacterized protein [Phascolarctobacterium sp. CAG:266]|nr:putative uncharacterized protein [Phascolarctobacterium sp. CAG:266]
MDLLYSVFLYLLVFLTTVLMCYIINLKYNNLDGREVIIRRCLLAFAVLLPTLIAGLRGDFVGTDMHVYILDDFYLSENKSFNELLRVLPGREFGYLLLLYITSRFSDTPVLFLSCAQLLTYGLVLFGIYKLRDKINFTVAVSVYLFLFYNMSFNILRQSIACAFLFLAFIYLYDRKKIKFICLALLACLFHKVAIVGLILLIILYFYNNLQLASLQSYLLPIFLITLGVYIFYKEFFVFLLNNFDFPDYLKNYINIIVMQTTIGNQFYFIQSIGKGLILELCFKVLFVIIPYMLLKRHNENNILRFSLIVAFTSSCIYLFGFFAFNTIYAYRITMFLDYFLIILLAVSIKDSCKFLKNILIIVMLFYYWLGVYMLMGWHGTNLYYFR